MTHVLDVHYAAYGAGDIDALMGTLADGFRCGALNGQTWIDGKDVARPMYQANVVDYPLSLTRTLAETALGAVHVRRETSQPGDPTKAVGEVLAFYTVEDGLITRLDMAREPGNETVTLDVVARQLDAYNRQDLDAHVACFHPDIVVADLNGAESLHGIDAYRERYRGVFAQFPQNRAEALVRISLGGVAVDHERVWRSPDAQPFEVLAVYTLKDGLIARVDFVR